MPKLIRWFPNRIGAAVMKIMWMKMRWLAKVLHDDLHIVVVKLRFEKI